MPSREHSARRSRRNRELEWHSPPLLMQCSEPILRSETWPTNQVDPHVRYTRSWAFVIRLSCHGFALSGRSPGEATCQHNFHGGTIRSIRGDLCLTTRSEEHTSELQSRLPL